MFTFGLAAEGKEEFRDVKNDKGPLQQTTMKFRFTFTFIVPIEGSLCFLYELATTKTWYRILLVTLWEYQNAMMNCLV